MIIERKINKEIKKYIDDNQIIVIHGARQVGKTSVMTYFFNWLSRERNIKDIYYFDLEDRQFLTLLNNGVEDTIQYLKEKGLEFNSRTYLFIDEIQYLENPSGFLKLFYDRYKGRVKLLVSGSSSFNIRSKFKDSLVGRTIDFELYPLDFEEFLIFKKKRYKITPSMQDTTNNELKSLYKIYILYGGYPQIVLTESIEKKRRFLNQIINSYIKKDIRDLARIKNIDKFNKLLEILAGQSGNLLNIVELCGTTGLARQTIEEYLFILENTYIIRRLKPFAQNLRSELFKMPKVYFYDTGLMHLLWLKNFPEQIFGQSLETSFFSELSKNTEQDFLYFWRTKSRQEIDFLYVNKAIIAMEIKNMGHQFKNSVFSFFRKKYEDSRVYNVFMEGKRNIDSLFEQKYPWEMIKLLNQPPS